MHVHACPRSCLLDGRSGIIHSLFYLNRNIWFVYFACATKLGPPLWEVEYFYFHSPFYVPVDLFVG